MSETEKKQMGIRIANAPLEALPGAWLLLPAPSAGPRENAAWSMSAPDGTGLREGTAAWKASPPSLLTLPSLPLEPQWQG